MQLYNFPKSGNCWKVRLMLGFLEKPVEIIDLNLPEGEHHTPEYRALNPLSQVPVLRDQGEILRDSQAIIWYLVRRYDSSGKWYPSDLVAQARIAGWLSLSANELANGPSALRLIKIFGASFDPAQARAAADKACAYIEETLEGRDWLLGGSHPTIADVACYPYLALAHEGDYSLERFPALQSWLARFEALPLYRALEPVDAPSLR